MTTALRAGSVAEEEEAVERKRTSPEYEQVSKELLNVVDTYQREYVGRERTIRLIILALISRQHIYMISPPGTGKTMMENVARSFGMNTFYYLYNYDVKLEDILYNPIIKKIPIENGEKVIIDYELKVPGLGTSDIHFADEMFKAPTAVLNALLGAMNERRVTLGSKEYRIPLWSLVAASNELPDRADALLDRFLFRDFLKYLPKDMWLEYLVKYWNVHQLTYQRVRVSVPRTVLEKAHELMWKVDIYGVLDDYVKLLDKLHEHNIILSDRRKGRILQAITASAVLAGRDTAVPEDLEVLLYTIPTREDEVEVVAKKLDEYLGGMLKVKEELRKLKEQIRSFGSTINNKSINEIAEFARNIPSIRNRLTSVAFPSLQSYVDRIATLLDEVEAQIVDVIAKKLLVE